ncbi:Mss4-like protein [Mycena polygramma]|nr:Mss4-like protein [Mycena polygramma]
MATAVKRLGSCLCKRKFTGSAFMTNAFFGADKITVTEGADLVRKYEDNDTTSRNTLTRSFCSECGTSLFLSSPTKTEWISVCPAAVNDDQAWVPRKENRPDVKFPWVTALHIEPKPPKL